jgi:hypothetical protein
MDDAKDGDVDDKLVRGTISLTDIYSRCNVVVVKTTNFEEPINSQVWITTIKKELIMIQKNQTQVLIDKLVHKKIIGVK